MAITDGENGNGGMIMPVQPMGGYPQAPMHYGNNGGFGDNESWLILFIILAMSGNWGLGGFGGGMGAMGTMGAMDGMMLWPWLMTQSVDMDVQGGFNQAATQGAIEGVRGAVTTGFGDTALGIAGINQNICQSGNATVAAITGAQNAIAQQMYGNQISALERSFAAQTAQTAGMTALQSQFADCCCENRLGIANLGADIAREACADRAAVNDALRDVGTQNAANTNAIITTITGGIQSIKDQLCQDKIDAKNDEIAALRQQVNMQNLAASQAQQTREIETYVRPQINPAYVVPNPYAYNFQPQNGWNCGQSCGCGGF